jgi:hypothetical protein
MANVAINCWNRRYMVDLHVAKMDPNIRIAPSSKAPLEQKVLRVMARDGQKCPIIFLAASE